MGLLRLNKTLQKSKFLAGWEIDFDNPNSLKNYILTHAIDEENAMFFSRLQSSTELTISDHTILETLVRSGKNLKKTKCSYDLPINEWPNRNAFLLKKANSGTHIIGGEVPSSFKIPTCTKLKSSFVYLASLDGNDNNLKWLNLERIHIAYPLYEGAFQIFLNYEDPNAPKILNPEVFTYSWIKEDKINLEYLQYKKCLYKSIHTSEVMNPENISDDYLLCGVPIWYQYPEIPMSPKNGKLMQFVATINSDRNILTHNNPRDKNLPFTNDYLIFGDYGHLYIFYEPESKVLSL